MTEESKSIGSMIADGATAIKDLFISSKEREYRQFVADKEERARVPNTFRILNEEFAEVSQSSQIFREKLNFVKDSNLALSIFESAKNKGLFHAPQVIASELVSWALLKQMEPELRQLDEKRLKEAVAKLETFKKENGKLLRELGLI